MSEILEAVNDTPTTESKPDLKIDPKTTMQASKGQHPIVGSMLLNPIESYRMYGIVPKKLMIHIVILVLSSVYCFQMNEVTTKFIDPQIKAFHKKFLNPEDNFS